MSHTSIEYAREIVKAGYNGVAHAEAPQMGLVSQNALAPAALGAAVAVLGVYLGRKGRTGSAALIGGILGCAVGFVGGVAWGTRSHASEAAKNALQNVQAVRDAHWLEKNPVAYA